MEANLMKTSLSPERSRPADPSGTSNSYYNTNAGVADKPVADRKSPASVVVDNSTPTTERGIQTMQEQPVDMIKRMPVVFIHNLIVKRAQLPFPHTNSSELKKIVDQLNHPDFKFTHIEESMIKTAEKMESQQGPAIEHLVARLPTSDDLPTYLTSIAREVFFANATDGVFWARLIAVFVFAGRVAVQCVKTEAGNYVPAISVCLQKLILEHLHSDIERLGGWNAFVAYCDRADQRIRPMDASSFKSGRLRSFLTRLATVASKGSDVDESQENCPASPQPLISTVGWFVAPIALGASALYDAITRGTEF